MITCRAIWKKILKILYNRNRWLLVSRARFNVELFSFWIMFMKKFDAYFRHIIFVYNHRNDRGTQKKMILINELFKKWIKNECFRNLHESATKRMINHWKTINNCLTHVIHVESISVDVQNLYCFMNCCRNHIVKLLFINYFLKSSQGSFLHKSTNLDILELKSDRERFMFDAWRTFKQKQLAIL